MTPEPQSEWSQSLLPERPHCLKLAIEDLNSHNAFVCLVVRVGNENAAARFSPITYVVTV